MMILRKDAKVMCVMEVAVFFLDTAATIIESMNGMRATSIACDKQAVVKNNHPVVSMLDDIELLEQYSEHSFKIQAVSSTGVKYTYQTSASDETVLEYYETWDESEYPDKYSGSASLCR